MLHLNLDNSWPAQSLSLDTVDALEWGPQLRFSAPQRLVERFYRDVARQLPAFLLYGSGDFHHLTALWMRKLSESFVVLSFDNHPDWDVRPPRWCCGGWVNRALELSQVRKVAVWGCANFECWWPGRIFGNRRAEAEGKLDLHSWADDRPAADRQRKGAIFRATWREHFSQFAAEMRGLNVYVTIDLDCLRAEEAITNWENGKFTVDDLIWAISELRPGSKIVAGDICGAFSQPVYARWTQRFASEMDHPKVSRPGLEEARRINQAALNRLRPILEA